MKKCGGNNLKQMKYKAFTLIELLVVIVIIGILATLSTAFFSGAKTKALISKYKAERIIASKERYDECRALKVYDKCGPNFVLYRKGLNDVRKKDIGDGPGDGERFLSGGFNSAVFSPDGTYLYFNATAGGTTYRRDMKDPMAYVTVKNWDSSGTGAEAITVDGNYLLYSYGSQSTYKKDLSTGPSVASQRILSGVGFYPTMAPHGLSFFHRGGSGASAGRVHEKQLSDASTSSPGQQITSDPVAPFEDNIAVDPDGEFIIYVNSSHGNYLYKKDLDGVVGPGTQINSISSSIPRITIDGRYVLYRAAPGGVFQRDIHKKELSDTSTSNGELWIPSVYYEGPLVLFP